MKVRMCLCAHCNFSCCEHSHHILHGFKPSRLQGRLGFRVVASEFAWVYFGLVMLRWMPTVVFHVENYTAMDLV